MKKLNILCIAFLVTVAGYSQQVPEITYEIDITKNPDTFYVRLMINKMLSRENNIFQFPSTAPGAYQTMDIGRFVSHFSAFDKQGNRLNVKKISVNQFRIADPHRLVSISYRVAETFDTPVDSFSIYLMAGSTIKGDYSLINTHAVAGYIQGLELAPCKIKLIRPNDWKDGTSLQVKNGFFVADNFDQLVDGPILTGRLTYADKVISGSIIRVFSFSESEEIDADVLLEYMSKMLAATKIFLIKLPVDRYTFLYCFINNPPGSTGALEHSYSSAYVMKLPNKISASYFARITDIASHEFFHILTPLNLHSELISSFNFVSPVSSKHLWLYEGVTEWASKILQYRSGLIDLQGSRYSYISQAIQYKILSYEVQYNKNWSLINIAESSYTKTGAAQYQNIYHKGALVATYLDILLLELSDGKNGLRELLLELSNKYGKKKPFSEKHLIDEIVSMTYPEVRCFFDKYVLGNDYLPHEEYLEKIGLSYEEELMNGDTLYIVKKMDNMSSQQRKLFSAWSVNLE